MIGKNIKGYIIKEFLGRGSFGAVYTCEKNNELHAIKIFNADFVFEQYRKNPNDNRITREIQALKMVDSPYVVKYIDDGTFEDNENTYIYVIMDYIKGMDLDTFLKNSQIGIDEALKIFKNIVIGLDAIHKLNIVHRDLKPSNIYIINNQDIRIMDFGLSKLIDFTSITSTGDEIGSPLYMSPEQVQDSKNIDYRSDYYALGVILFQLLAKHHPYGEIQSKQELYYKIINEPPLSIRNYVPTIYNSIDNLIESLLQKLNYQRPNTVNEILEYLDVSKNITKELPQVKFNPSFYLRVWNEKQILIDYYKDGYEIENCIFPINHQDLQKNLLKHIKDKSIDLIIDPATMRLAYDTYSEVKGLVALPYAPSDLNRLEIDDFKSIESKRDYVKSVIIEQFKHGDKKIVSPFHVSNNSNLVKIKNDENENWFTLDIKLLGESRDYLNSIDSHAELIGGFCIKTDILTAKTEREYFLNVLTGLDCDTYWIYVDCIDNNSNVSQLYHYANTLLQLQKHTNKPVIAGRIGAFGLVLLAFGLYAFESGASRFETFYEDLYTAPSDPFNMYLNYYFPELLRNIPIERKKPTKIIQLLASTTGKEIGCNCPYCSGKKPEELVNEPLSKKHFLYRRQQEINELRDLSTIKERVDYIENKINNSIEYHKALTPIFKADDYRHLRIWLEVINKLKEDWIAV